MMALMFAIVEMSRAHSESAIKAERTRAHVQKRRVQMRERTDAKPRAIPDGQLLGHTVPAWIVRTGATISQRVVNSVRRMVPTGGRLELDKKKAAVVKRVFRMAHDGTSIRARQAPYGDTLARAWDAVIAAGGLYAIYALFSFPTMTARSARWSQHSVYGMLTNRAVLGEFQPAEGGKPVGAPIADYYPRVVRADVFDKVQNMIATRAASGRGRRSEKHVNLFAGLLKCARTGDTFTYGRFNGQKDATLIPIGAKLGKGREYTYSSFPAKPLEFALLHQMREITADELDDGVRPDPVRELDVAIAKTEEVIAEWTGRMSDLRIADLVATKLGEFNTELADLKTRRDRAGKLAADPLSAAWDTVRTLGAVLLKRNDNETRTRVQAALRRSITAVTCLFFGIGRKRVALVRVDFCSGCAKSTTHRDFVVTFDPPRSNKHVKRPGVCHAASTAGTKLDKLDLREPAHAKMMEASITASAKALAAFEVGPAIPLD